MNPTDEKLTAMLAAYSQAVADKDLEAFLQLYDPAVRVFDAWDAWSYEGRDAWRESIRAWFSAESHDVHVRFEDVQMRKVDGIGTLTAVVSYAAVAADGLQTREIHNRLTWILRERDGVWRICHEHTSAPVRFGNFQALLQRSREAAPCRDRPRTTS